MNAGNDFKFAQHEQIVGLATPLNSNNCLGLVPLRVVNQLSDNFCCIYNGFNKLKGHVFLHVQTLEYNRLMEVRLCHAVFHEFVTTSQYRQVNELDTNYFTIILFIFWRKEQGI